MRNSKLTTIIILTALLAWAGIANAAVSRTGRHSGDRSAISSRESTVQRSHASTSTGTREIMRATRSRRTASLTQGSSAKVFLSSPLARTGGTTLWQSLRSPTTSDYRARSSGTRTTRRQRDKTSADRRRRGDTKRVRGSPIITRDGKTIPIRSGRHDSKSRYSSRKRHDSRIRLPSVYIRPFCDRNEVYLSYGRSHSHTSTRYAVYVYYPTYYRSSSLQKTVEGTLTTLASNEVVLVVDMYGEKVSMPWR